MALMNALKVPFLLLIAAVPTHARFLRAHTSTATGHPVEDIITLLKSLDAQAVEEGKAEQVTYQKFEHWCVRSKKELKETIAKGEATIEALSDEITSLTGENDTLSTQIDSLTDEMAKLDRDDAKADRRRESGEHLYGNRTESLEGTIEAVYYAITNLTDARDETDPSLIQRHIDRVIEAAGEHLSGADINLLENATSNTTRPVLKAEGDYEDHIDEYAFKSHGVIEMLKKLLHDFESQLEDAHKAETNAVNAFELSGAARQDMFDAAHESREEKKDVRNEVQRHLGDAEDERRNTQNDLDADENTLGSTTQSCDQKAAEYSERSRVRSAEREAIHTAVGILVKVSGVRTEEPENPALPQPVVFQQLSFLQLSNPEFEKAVELLRQDAKVTHSKAISQLAAAIAANDEGPFDQAINSIEKMVFHLQNEQKEEDEHKHWCDLELEKTNTSIDEKDDKLDELSGKIDVAQTRANLLLREIGDADREVNTIVKHMTEAAEIRETGRDENSLAIKDAEAAQTALTKAIAVLTTFYKSSGAVQKEDWEFIQQRGAAPVELKESPETWDAPTYTSVADPMDGSNGVLKLLEQVLADFSSMESNTIAQEETDQHAFEQDIKECKIEKARLMKESEMKAADRKNVLERQRSLETTHKRVSNEREATLQYLHDLEPACVNGDSTYADRKSARSQEITALKAAKDHLHNAFKNITRT